MSSINPPKFEMGITVMTLVTAIGTALGAFAIFQPKIAIAASMKRETGVIEPAFRILYSIPQYLNMIVVGGVLVALIAAFIHALYPAFLANYALFNQINSFFILENLGWILLLVAALAVVIQINWLCWVLLAISAFGAMLPIWRFRGAFGRKGQSAGWHQAFNICRAWDKGFPLLICPDEIERLANQILFRLTQPDSSTTNFADKPKNADSIAAANIALFGCILESTHYAQRWDSPKWSVFYDALSTIHDSTQIFNPQKLTAFTSGEVFSDFLRGELVTTMTARSQPIPPDKYLAAAGYISVCWAKLKERDGSLFKLVPCCAALFGGRMFWLDRALSRLPMLNNEGMRPQLIKLLLRWKTIPWAKPTVFTQPFAKGQAWLLLQEGALRVLPGQNDVTFWGSGDVALVQIACLRIFRRVAQIVAAKDSTEAKNVAAKYTGQWDLFAAADFALWDWAKVDAERGRSDSWSATKGWRWKSEAGRASKIS